MSAQELVRAVRRIQRSIRLQRARVAGVSVRQTILGELEIAYSLGYRAAHEAQMRARILDRMECEAKHGR